MMMPAANSPTRTHENLCTVLLRSARQRPDELVERPHAGYADDDAPNERTAHSPNLPQRGSEIQMNTSPTHAAAETIAEMFPAELVPSGPVPHAAAMIDGLPVGELEAAGRPAWPTFPGDPPPPYRPPTTDPLTPVPKFIALRFPVGPG